MAINAIEINSILSLNYFQFEEKYNNIRNYLFENKEIISYIEEKSLDNLVNEIQNLKNKIKKDYDEASFLRPFWVNYPPDDRGRQPRGDQVPWIEVGEHVISDHLISNLNPKNNYSFPGIPAGPDIRYVVSNEAIFLKTDRRISGFWNLIDVKSVGPRDDFNHAVMSHNQVSGDGKWDKKTNGIKNSVFIARGKKASHPFHCSLPPFYIREDGKVFLSVTLFIKPLYSMGENENFAQYLKSIKIGCIPNGLLLSGVDGLLNKYPSLIFPGKDDKKKNPKKLRARVDFKLLSRINAWRLKEILF